VPPSLNFPQLDFVKPSSGFHPVTWERVMAHHENKNANFSMHPTTHQLNHSCKHESINLGKIVRLTPKCFSLGKKRGGFVFL
jgi:hypothetical protein